LTVEDQSDNCWKGAAALPTICIPWQAWIWYNTVIQRRYTWFDVTFI